MRGWPSRLGCLLILGAVFAHPSKCSADAAFPLTVRPGGRYLADAAGNPFLIQGDTAWSLIAQLRREDVEHYLTDRRRRGFNAIVVSLIEHRFASDAPNNAYGEPPFVVPGDFATPNEAYFEHADWVLRRAAELGFLVLLAPCYAGINGGAEGWYGEMKAAGAERLFQYGEFLGRRYGRFTNILWVNAGDYDPPDRSLVRAIAEGIAVHDPEALQTAGGAPESAALDHWRSEHWLRVNTVYTYAPVFKAMRAQATRREQMPYFLFESAYENEHGATGQRLREQAYQALLGGAAGQVFGNNPIWHFDGPGIHPVPFTWQEALDSEGARSMTHLGSLAAALPWWKMTPDWEHRLLTDGLGPEEDRAVAAAADDGSFALVYLATRREVEIDLARLAGPRVEARWYDPSSGTFTAASRVLLAAVGTYRFGEMLPPNAAGQEDWVLLLESRR